MKRELMPWFNSKGNGREMIKKEDDFFSDMYQSINRAFADVIKEFGGFEISKKGFGFNPNFDIKEAEHDYVIKAELSGMDEKDVEISVEENLLKISGEKKEEISDKKGKYHVSERKFGSFERSFTLPPEIDSSKIKASFSKGVLSIHLPKNEKANTKKIEIKTE